MVRFCQIYGRKPLEKKFHGIPLFILTWIFILLQQMKDKVRYVKNIHIVKDVTGKDTLAVKARGIAELKMKINPVLVPREYESEPEDGIYEMDFTLDDTKDTYTNVDLEVEVVFYFRNLPAWVKGIRINAEENSDIELI